MPKDAASPDVPKEAADGGTGVKSIVNAIAYWGFGFVIFMPLVLGGYGSLSQG